MGQFDQHTKKHNWKIIASEKGKQCKRVEKKERQNETDVCVCEWV